MKIDINLVRKLNKEIMEDVLILLQKIEKLDSGYENGYVQCAIVAELCTEVYNSHRGDIITSDIMKIVYDAKELK